MVGTWDFFQTFQNEKVVQFNPNSEGLKGIAQGIAKGAILCFKNLYFYFRHGESTSTASQLTSPASQKVRI